MPSMVFVQRDEELYVCAVKSKERPDDNSEVFYAPMFNTYADGKVCLGDIKLEFPDTPTKMLANQGNFLRGVNTHPNGHHIKTSYKFGLFGLWKKLLDKPATKWNDNWLAPTDQTLDEWLNKVLP